VNKSDFPRPLQLSIGSRGMTATGRLWPLLAVAATSGYGACLTSGRWLPKSNALMRTPNAVKYRLSHDTEFLPA
jgi:hypothetical protein